MLGQGVSIDSLVIVRRAREGHKYRWFPGSGDFGDRTGAGSAYQQIRTREGCRHVFDEPEDLG